MKHEENRRHPAMKDLSDAEIETLIEQGSVYREDALVSEAHFPKHGCQDGHHELFTFTQGHYEKNHE